MKTDEPSVPAIGEKIVVRDNWTQTLVRGTVIEVNYNLRAFVIRTDLRYQPESYTIAFEGDWDYERVSE